MHPKLACDSSLGVGVAKPQLLQMEIDALQAKHAVERAPSTLGFYTRVFLVPKKNGKQRLVFNISLLTNSLWLMAFKWLSK